MKNTCAIHRSACSQALLLVVLILIQVGCNPPANQPAPQSEAMPNSPMPNITPEKLAAFRWLNQPKSFETANGILKVTAGKETDFFNNPEDNKVTSTAPVLFREMTGNFVATALVKPDFSSLWNATGLMVHIDNNNWIKFGFENSDATGRGIVSVVTRNLSDDTNGVTLADQDRIWLKLIRRDNIYSMLWSKDGKDFKMARLSTLPAADTVKIGVEFQSPVGDSAVHELRYFEVVETTVKDLRKGE